MRQHLGITAKRVFLVSYIFVTLHVYLYSEPLLLEHKEVVVDMISRSFAEKGDLTTLANVTYDNIAEQVSSKGPFILLCRFFSLNRPTKFEFGATFTIVV